MSEIAIRVEHLSKRYRIGAEEQVHDTFLGSVWGGLKRAGTNLRKLRSLTDFGGDPNNQKDVIWALRDVSFDVRPGEVIGVIGRNGAGKSTLLKILSQITHPNEGRVELHGRISSLLEVGTGFHPELTGRENVYLNGTLLGMRTKEVERKFDEIVDFSGIEKFIDTPVKRYSTGMRVRLGFAVAAFLEPEILMIDEVLAVGDGEFQRRCLGKMGEVARSGRTVLFVSHQLAAVQNICGRSILLEAGRIACDDTTERVISQYLSGPTSPGRDSLAVRTDREGSGVIRFQGVSLLDSEKFPVSAFKTGDDVTIRLTYWNRDGKPLKNLHIGVGIDDFSGQRITVLNNDASQGVFPVVDGANRMIEIEINKLPLKPGRYYLTLFSKSDHEVLDRVSHAGSFDVEAGDYYGTGKLTPDHQGFFLVDYRFNIPGLQFDSE